MNTKYHISDNRTVTYIVIVAVRRVAATNEVIDVGGRAGRN